MANTNEIAKTVQFKTLRNTKVIDTWSVVRTNTVNGFPYITLTKTELVNGKPESKTNNVYFGKKSAEIALKLVPSNMNDRTEVNKCLRDLTLLLVNAEVYDTKNNNDEARFKISFEGDSDYASQSMIDDLFGALEVSDSGFDLDRFKSEFTFKDGVVTTTTGSKTLPTKAQYDADYAELQSQLALARTNPAKAKVQAKIAKLEEIGHS